MKEFELEIENGQRYEFGENWRKFLTTLNDEKIRIAENSLKDMLGVEDLYGKTFLDIGSGSGLFSLAARRMGAVVTSFDYDPKSVECTQKLKSLYYPDDNRWVIKRESVLDRELLNNYGKYDIVYSWGVLHHTGNMWKALENAASLVEDEGTIFIAIYNDQGKLSRFWKRVKEVYCSGFFGKIAVAIIFIPFYIILYILLCIVRKENVFTMYKTNRGMSIVHDWFDWLGGLPFEVAKIEDIFKFFKNRKFVLENIQTTNRLGNNQFVFTKAI